MSIIKNVDIVKGADIFGCQQCMFRANFIEQVMGWEAQAGTIILYDKKNKKWRFGYDFHFWNIDNDGNLWDSHSCLTEWCNINPEYKKPKTFNYKLMSAFDWNYPPQHPGDSLKIDVVMWINKFIPKNKYDMIYVYGMGYNRHLSNQLVLEDEMYENMYSYELKKSVIEEYKLLNEMSVVV